MKKKVISMFLTACTVSVMVVGGGSNLVMADDAETVTLMGWYDEDDMNPILEKVNEQMDGKYVSTHMLKILIIIMYLAHSLHLEKAQTLLWMEQTIQPKSKLVTWKTFRIMIL